MDGMLDKVADYYESEAKTDLHRNVTIFCVLVLLFVAMIVFNVVFHFWSGYGSGLTHAANG